MMNKHPLFFIMMFYFLKSIFFNTFPALRIAKRNEYTFLWISWVDLQIFLPFTATFILSVSLSCKEYGIIVKALLEHVLLTCPLYIYPWRVSLYPTLLNDNPSCNIEYQLFEMFIFLCGHDDLWYVHQISSVRQVCMKSCMGKL